MSSRVQPKNLSWTRSQDEAIRYFEGDVCVSAGAGSGKTAVLVERYLYAVEHKGFRPQEILAITFTDKAAAEMRRRLIEKSVERGFLNLRADLEVAPIGTIHSFCARLLRENPVECGMDPEFRVLSEAEQELLQTRVFEAVVEAESTRPEVLDLLSTYGEEEVHDALARLHEQRRSLGSDLPIREPDWEDLERSARSALERELKELLSARRKTGEWTQTEVRTRASASEAVQALAAPSGWDRLEGVCRAIQGFHANSAALKARVQASRAALEEWESAEAARLSRPLRSAFLDLFGRYRLRLEQEKNHAGAYDFDDLIDKVLTALRAEDPVRRAFAARLQTRFKALLVDEYQDVNPAQAALIRHLKGPGNRFVVGDHRQSIYGFRHADPEIFEKTRTDSRSIVLSENFRSRRPVIDFVNAFFSASFPQESPLSASRGYFERKTPCIEILKVDTAPGEEKPLDRARVREARLLAGRLRDLVDSGYEVEPKEGERRPVEWRDIAVLFRKSTAIRLYDRAFREAGIPFDLPKGKGFFEKSEIVDGVSFLSILRDPLEDIPLAAVLRSPLVGLSEDSLFELGQTKKGKEMPLFAALEQTVLSGEDEAKRKKFLDQFRALRLSRERLGLSRLLESAIGDAPYRTAVAASAGPQALANVDKLIDLARQTEEAGGGVADFVRLARVLGEREEGEPEARMPHDPGNTVSFLTVHAAKGLEFPVVVVADMGARPQAGGCLFQFSSAGELGMRFYSPEDGRTLADPVYRRLKAESDVRARRESERLLYVAMTRAKEHLILSGARSAKASPTEEESEDSSREPVERDWMALVFETCGFDRSQERSTEPWKGTPLGWISDSRETRASKLSAPHVRAAEPIGSKESFLLPTKPYEMVEDITVTGLVEAANRELLRDLLAEEPDKQALSRREEDEEPAVPANRFGTVYHKLMELSMRPAVLGPLPPGEFDEWTREFGDAQKQDLRRQMETFWKGEWARPLRRASRRYPELPFIYKSRHGLLKGQIDLVFKTAEGSWVILDYKTNRVTAEGMEETAARYEFQLALYALVFAELTGETPAHGVLYFSSIGRSKVFEIDPERLARTRERLERIHQEVLETL